MMISPDNYYDEYLKGKTAEEIMTTIRGLKQKMGRLKNIMEQPDYVERMCPSESTQLWCTRLYLKRAKQALIEAGGVYNPSQAELKSAAFDANISDISRVVFTIGGFLGGYTSRSFVVNDDELQVFEKQLYSSDEWVLLPNYPLFRYELLEGIQKLHIGEWKSLYYEPDVLDGTQWSLELYYSNGQKAVEISGSNRYPYNFEELLELLCMNDSEL